MMAIGMASLGALYSISLAIRDRNIQTDRLRRDNLLDAGLRIAIACVSAVVLFALINGKIVSIKFGATELRVDWAKDRWAPMVVAFLSGFSERLVRTSCRCLSGCQDRGNHPRRGGVNCRAGRE